jgi:hypothetical protein
MNIIVHHAPVIQLDKLIDVGNFSVIDLGSEFNIYNAYNYKYGNVFGKVIWEDK